MLLLKGKHILLIISDRVLDMHTFSSSLFMRDFSSRVFFCLFFFTNLNFFEDGSIAPLLGWIYIFGAGFTNALPATALPFIRAWDQQ